MVLVHNENAYIRDVQYGVTGYGVRGTGFNGVAYKDSAMGTDFTIRVARYPGRV
jgi:hypothetical protein